MPEEEIGRSELLRLWVLDAAKRVEETGTPETRRIVRVWQERLAAKLPAADTELGALLLDHVTLGTWAETLQGMRELMSTQHLDAVTRLVSGLDVTFVPDNLIAVDRVSHEAAAEVSADPEKRDAIAGLTQLVNRPEFARVANW